MFILVVLNRFGNILELGTGDNAPSSRCGQTVCKGGMRGSSRCVMRATSGSLEPADEGRSISEEKGGDPARPPPRLSETVAPRFQGHIHCSFFVHTFMVDNEAVLSAASGYRYVYTCYLSYHFSLRQHNLPQHDSSSSTRPKVRTDVMEVLVGDLYWNVLKASAGKEKIYNLSFSRMACAHHILKEELGRKPRYSHQCSFKCYIGTSITTPMLELL